MPYPNTAGGDFAGARCVDDRDELSVINRQRHAPQGETVLSSPWS